MHMKARKTFAKLRNADPAVLEYLAAQYPPASETERERIFQKSLRKYEMRTAPAAEQETYLVETRTGFDWIRGFSAVAASLMLCTAVGGGIWYLHRAAPEQKTLETLTETVAQHQQIEPPAVTEITTEADMTETNAEASDKTEPPSTLTSPPAPAAIHLPYSSRNEFSVPQISTDRNAQGTTVANAIAVPVVQNTTPVEKTNANTEPVYTGTYAVTMTAFTTTKQTTSATAATVPDGTRITRADLLALAKEETLTWNDFAQFQHQDIGSGINIWELIVDAEFTLHVCGLEQVDTAWLIASNGDRIDLQNGDVEAFLNASHIATTTAPVQTTAAATTTHEWATAPISVKATPVDGFGYITWKKYGNEWGEWASFLVLNEDTSVTKLTTNYRTRWLPDQYCYGNAVETDDHRMTVWLDENLKALTFHQYLRRNCTTYWLSPCQWFSQFRAETTFESIQVNGAAGFIRWETTGGTIVWDNGESLFELTADTGSHITKEELIRAAEDVVAVE